MSVTHFRARRWSWTPQLPVELSGERDQIDSLSAIFLEPHKCEATLQKKVASGVNRERDGEVLEVFAPAEVRAPQAAWRGLRCAARRRRRSRVGRRADRRARRARSRCPGRSRRARRRAGARSSGWRRRRRAVVRSRRMRTSRSASGSRRGAGRRRRRSERGRRTCRVGGERELALCVCVCAKDLVYFWIPHNPNNNIKQTCVSFAYSMFQWFCNTENGVTGLDQERLFFCFFGIVEHAVLYFGLNGLFLSFDYFRIFQQYKLNRK